MGNLCSCLPGAKKENEHVSAGNHPFNSPGRTLDSAPGKPVTNTQKMGQGQSSQSKPQGAGRTLGGTQQSATASEQPQRREANEDMRSAAAKAAEARAQDKKPTGKLGQNLNKQKQQTMSETLGEASKQEVGARTADAGQEARNWN